MMDALGGGFWEWISQFSPGWAVALSAIGLGFWLVLSGRLVTRSSVESAFKIIEKQNEALKSSTETLPRIEQALETCNHVLAEIQRAGQDHQDGGSP